MPPRAPRAIVAVLVLGWVVAVALPPVGLAVVRRSWLESLGRPETRARWDDFRDAMRTQTGRDGPVQRKVPRSVEPPGLVWLRDHFALACAAWMLFGSVLWGVLAVFTLGVSAVSRRRRGDDESPSEQETGGQRHHEKKDRRDAEDAEQG